jgi:hypothetical protein
MIRTGLVALLFVAANILVAIRHVGSQPGQTYRWVCKQSGAQLSANPGVFGQVKLTGTPPTTSTPDQWQLLEPRPLPAWQPWNWLALVLERPAPDPDKLIRQGS